MPELPEVETLLIGLKGANIIDSSIVEVKFFCDRLSKGRNKDLHLRLVGARIQALSRRGKYLLFHLDKKKILALHLRMSGRIHLQKVQTLPHTYDRAIIALSNDVQLHFHDVRKFGTLSLVDEKDSLFTKLGSEPLSAAFSLDLFRQGLATSKMIKALLLDQQFIAGIGNIYADEALFLAKIHPKRKSRTLSFHEAFSLYDSIKTVLLNGIEKGGTSLGEGLGNFHSVNGKVGKNKGALLVYARAGDPCRRCHTPITKERIQQRSSHFCPACQLL